LEVSESLPWTPEKKMTVWIAQVVLEKADDYLRRW